MASDLITRWRRISRALFAKAGFVKRGPASRVEFKFSVDPKTLLRSGPAISRRQREAGHEDHNTD